MRLHILDVNNKLIINCTHNMIYRYRCQLCYLFVEFCLQSQLVITITHLIVRDFVTGDVTIVVHARCLSLLSQLSKSKILILYFDVILVTLKNFLPYVLVM